MFVSGCHPTRSSEYSTRYARFASPENDHTMPPAAPGCAAPRMGQTVGSPSAIRLVPFTSIPRAALARQFRRIRPGDLVERPVADEPNFVSGEARVDRVLNFRWRARQVPDAQFIELTADTSAR